MANVLSSTYSTQKLDPHPTHVALHFRVQPKPYLISLFEDQSFFTLPLPYLDVLKDFLKKDGGARVEMYSLIIRHIETAAPNTAHNQTSEFGLRSTRNRLRLKCSIPDFLAHGYNILHLH